MNIRAYYPTVIFFITFIGLSLQASSKDGSMSPTHQASPSLSEPSHSPKRSPERTLEASHSAKGLQVETSSKINRDRSPSGPSTPAKKLTSKLKILENPSTSRGPSGSPEEEHHIEQGRSNSDLKVHQSRKVRQTPAQDSKTLKRNQEVRDADARKKAMKQIRYRISRLDPDLYSRRRY